MKKLISFTLIVLALSLSTRADLLNYPNTTPDITTPELSIDYSLTGTGHTLHVSGLTLSGIALSPSSTDPDYYIFDSFFDIFMDLDVNLNPVSGTYLLSGELADADFNSLYTGTLLTGTIEKFGYSEIPGSAVMDFEFKTVINNLDDYMPFIADFFAVDVTPTGAIPTSFNFPQSELDGVSGIADTFPVTTIPAPSAAIGGGLILILGLGRKLIRSIR